VTTLYVDLETYSTVDLRASNVYRYSEDPSFLILMAAWSVDDGPIQVAIGEDAIRRIPHLQEEGIRRVAHNAQFERICLSRLFGYPTGQYWSPADWHDTMAVAAEKGYPQKLEYLARSLGGEEKDEAGTRLINLFCRPNRKGTRNLPGDFPEEWERFVAYCAQDVRTLADVDGMLGDFPTETERQVYLADQRVNDLGIEIDIELAAFAEEAAADNRMVQEIEISSLTGVDNPGSGPQMLVWLRAQRLDIGNMQKETIEKFLLGDLSPTVRRVLEIRQELALVAAKKYTAALGHVSSDGRLRGQFRFFGAHTGRWSGRGVQLHNLPRAQMADPTSEQVAILDLKLGLGADAPTLKALVRPMLTGPFTVVDYSSIEARVIAWLAGEEWALQAFRDRRDIYVETAERMSTPTNPLTRSQGKVAVLALGYNGGVGSLQAMGADGSPEDLQMLVDQWRRTNPAIVNFWATMDNAFRLGGPVGPHITVEKDGLDRLLRLPSGRAIVYHGCEWKWDTNKWGSRQRSASFLDPSRQGARAWTYGGRLAENVTQAVARDVLAEAMVRLHGGGYDIVGHVHDEILVEANATAAVKALMVDAPAWATGLPIDGEGFVCDRYRKG